MSFAHAVYTNVIRGKLNTGVELQSKAMSCVGILTCDALGVKKRPPRFNVS
jgi:hypothetical protein